MTIVMVKRTVGERLGPRERMIAGAADLVRVQGVAATGIRQVVEHARAPRGSVQHYFPDGKDQLVVEAIDWAADHTEAVLQDAATADPPLTAAELIDKVATYWRTSLTETDYLAGCTVFAAATDAATNDPVRTAVVAALKRWQATLATALSRAGITGPARAQRLSTLILVAIEGAIVLARAERSTTPIHSVVAELTELVSATATPRRG